VSGFAWLERAATARGAPLLAACLALSALAGAGWSWLGWTSSPEVITLEGSRALDEYREWLARWGSDELIVLAWDTPDAFAPESLEQLRSLSARLFDIEGVRWVSSLDSAVRIDTGPFGPYARPLVPDDVRSDASLREHALASPFLRDALVAADGRTLLAAVQLTGTELENDFAERHVLGAIDRVLAEPEFAGLDVHLAGSPVFNRELERLNRRDNALFTPLVLAVVTVLLSLLFRHPLPTALALSVTGLTLAWTLGSMGWLGVPMNITTSLLPPLLMVIGVAESVHLISAYLDRLRAGDARRAALAWTLREVGPACLWTSLTTVIGFASLFAVRIESVRTFAAFASLGVVAAFVVSVTVLPALLVRLPLERAARVRAGLGALELGRTAGRHPALAVLVVAASVLVGALGIPRIEVATHDGEFFSPDHAINRAYRFIEGRIGGVTPLEIEIEAPARGALAEPKALAAIASLQQRLGREPELTRGLSLVDLLRLAFPAVDLADADAVERGLFWLAALAPEETAQWTRDDWRRTRISARADAMTSARSEELLGELRADAARLLPAGWAVRFTGLVPVFSQMEQYLVDGQLQSYGSALLGVALSFVLVFRSLRLALLALVPNVVPILLVGGVMGLLGVRLDVATIMVASIALGIIVDDTIHFGQAFRRGLELHGSRESAIEHALDVAGRPVLLTSLILVAGFAVLGLSEFQPTRHFGVLVGVTVATALVAELVILPAALARFAPRRAAATTGAREAIT
jgi:hypothetical protein